MSKKRVAVTLRKPHTSADIESFVSSTPGDAPTPLTAAPTPKASLAEAAFEHDARSYRELTLYLPNELARKLTLYCMEHDVDVNALVAAAVTRHMEQAAQEAAMSWQVALDVLLRTLRGKLSAFIPLRQRSA